MDKKNQPNAKKYPHARIRGKPNRLWRTDSTRSIPEEFNRKFSDMRVFLNDAETSEVNMPSENVPKARTNQRMNQRIHESMNVSRSRSTSHSSQAVNMSRENIPQARTNRRVNQRIHDSMNVSRSRSTSHSSQAGSSYNKEFQHKVQTGQYNKQFSLHTSDKAGLSRKENRSMGSDSNERRDKRVFGYKRLSGLLTINAETVLMLLGNKNEGFVELLNQRELSPNILVLISHVVSYACESTFSQTKIAVLAIISHLYIDHIIKYILLLPYQTDREKFENKDFWNHPDRFFSSIIHICIEIIRLMPNTGYEKLSKVTAGLQTVIDALQKKGLVSNNDMLAKIRNLSERLETLTIEREKKEKIKEVDVNGTTLEYNPPDNFRFIDPFPTLEDIKSNREVFLMPNIVNGNYSNPEHYLDLQFRLLKEDFISPLRSGIQEYCSRLSRGEKIHGRIDNIRVYQKVRFVAPTCIANKMCVLVDISFGREKSFFARLENSKRLIYGSLIMFTHDNFNSMIFGTIACRDEKFLKNGQVAVELQSHLAYQKVASRTYTMIESEIYFEPYFQVLSALQHIEVDNFPMREYIVDVKVDSKAPKYISKNPRIIIPIEQNRSYSVNVLADNWPGSSVLKLDESQYAALRAALTHEFCVIQGPPGTGKTFLGLYLAMIFLYNKNHWYPAQPTDPEMNQLAIRPSSEEKIQRKNTNTPLLVVCYTNHALDQFLEGLLHKTKKITRLGNRSKNEELNNYNIKKKRASRRSGFNKLNVSASLTRDLWFELKDLKIAITDIEEIILETENKKVVIDFCTVFKTEMSFVERQKWILEGFEHSHHKRSARIAINQLNPQIDYFEDDLVDSDEEYCEEDFVDRMQLDEEDFIDVSIRKGSKFLYLWSTVVIENTIEGLRKSLSEIKNSKESDQSLLAKIEGEIERYTDIRNYIDFRLQQGPNTVLKKPVDLKFVDLNGLSADDRWNLYWYWHQKFKENIMSRLEALQEKYQTVLERYEEVQQIEDITILRDSLVVGMTTTGAAKYRPVLQALKSPIVIVEEAAEVSESHIITSLTSSCEHLILIGDHKQLRPTTATYRLARHYGLDISLFERMVTNGIHCSTLSVQHRMRPEIALLVAPTIYPNLQNHPTVENFPSITGIKKNLYFISHSELETQVSDTMSKRNNHEADFILFLCRHLILQGYEPEDITILTTYNGQMFSLRKKRQNMKLLQKVHITVVDNFQGEENKIILLSLVRSNLDEKIGFLSIENRVCVALSRAKYGLYIIGNINMLMKKSNIWVKMYNTLKQQDSIGSHLTLQCKIHDMELTQVSKDTDFQLCPEGGCSRQCGLILECGHECVSVCHVTDREHILYKCQEPCEKFCARNHQCKSFCYKIPCPNCTVQIDHTLNCGHLATLECHCDPKEYKCKVSVQVKLVLCGHTAIKPCSHDEKFVSCPEPCIKRLPCGHQCPKTCHLADDPDHIEFKCTKDCARYNAGCTMKHPCKKRCYEECSPCKVNVLKKHPNCDHRKRIHCSVDVDEELCKKPCKKQLPCGHPCKNICKENCDPTQCIEKVKKIGICGHEIITECGKNPNRKKCNGRCPLTLPCGHICNQTCRSCANGCSGMCTELVDHSFKSACGHNFKIPCYKKKLSLHSDSYELLRACTEPCKTELECGHNCGGTCGLCFQGSLHFPCKEQCNYPLLCGHTCESKCRQNCPPCLKKCDFKCQHSECSLKCGEPCKPCMEPCLRQCEHGKCSRKCGNICDRKPCDYPCPKKLSCGHDCVGFCGESCPEKCRICDAEELTTIVFGPEDEPDARFVKLEDCGHIIVATALDTYLQMKPENDTEIKLYNCPFCKTPISKTQRYADLIKIMYKDVIAVKQKVFGASIENEKRKKQAFKQIINLKNKACFVNVHNLSNIINDLSALLDGTIYKGRRQCINQFELTVYEIQIAALTEIAEILEKVLLYCHVIPDILLDRLKYISNFLSLTRSKISKQETKDLNQELARLYILSKLCIIQSSTIYKICGLSSIQNINETAMKMILKLGPFDDNLSRVSNEMIKSLQKTLKQNIVTEEERRQVVLAMHRDNVKLGAWYKCPNGHYYTIGECGGATVVSKCIECGEKVGGTGHALLSTNRHAGEIDNSQYAAWSDLANMNNYVFD